MYIADEHNQRIRFVSASTGIISTFAGDGNNDFIGYNGDGLAATTASFSYPSGVALDSSGRRSYLPRIMLVMSNHTNLSSLFI